MSTTMPDAENALGCFHPTLGRWFLATYQQPTTAQAMAWPRIAAGENTLLLAPTGSGKTLAAFLVAINRIMFAEDPTDELIADETDESRSVGTDGRAKSSRNRGVRTLYISPLKALGVDVQRNLHAPLADVERAAIAEQVRYRLPSIGIRSGDTPAAERERIRRDPPDILITTPESLYLMLTSRARAVLTTVETVIIDEIHTMVATKRGAHLFVSLERLEGLRRASSPGAKSMQRIGLSATQRPLEEVARLLGGADWNATTAESVPRPVAIVEAGNRRALELKIEVPVEDMTALAVSQAANRTPSPGGSQTSSSNPSIPSIWPAIHPRLVELIRTHQSTMIFVNSRRLAERLATSINEFADEELAMAHHGSIAKDMRLQIEDRLKQGELPAIVATSSLELGIDMGAVDLVIQIEAPPTIASGIQRIGRAGHQVGAVSEGVIFPKFRGDLLSCSAATERMLAGEVEATYYPRNPLDVLAQQIVAMVALEPQAVDDTFHTIRQAAPFHELPRPVFENVLDLLSGRFPSDAFSELRPRIHWDRIQNQVVPRKGAQRLAILNAGTIPDRGLYGVFLADGESTSSRVGELDEEMVFETQPGDVFLLGASSWRVVEITHDRVLVAPAPGEVGRMPFWRGDGPGRPLEFGQAIGALTRQLLQLPRSAAESKLGQDHALEPTAAKNLVDYLHDQRQATRDVPSDKTIVIESYQDEVGDWRVAILSPFGSRVHAPWAMAVRARLEEDGGDDIDIVWTDDGIMFRVKNSDAPPSIAGIVPPSDSIEETVTNQLGSSALFAARFRENAARALLLPRQNPGRRTPLWVQRRRSADLLKVAAEFHNFPILLETYRECLRDVFDIRGLRSILQSIERREITVHHVTTNSPSPFTSTILYTYTANFLYDSDIPLTERRARSLALDHAQLKELLGETELRQLLDAETVDVVALQLQRLDGKFPVDNLDGLHELLLKLGDLSADEIRQRVSAEWEPDLARTLESLEADRRIVLLRVAGESRYVAAEDAARFRDGLGAALPPGLPDAFLEPVADPLGDLVRRYARTHVPFRIEDAAARLGIGRATMSEVLRQLAAQDRVLEGEFLPGGRGSEWCDANVLRMLKRKSLARLRKQIEPVSYASLARFLPAWQSVTNPRRGLDGLLDVIEQLQGIPLPASSWEQEILPARVEDFGASDLDELCSAGEIIWQGMGTLGQRDGRVSLYLADRFPLLGRQPEVVEDELQIEICQLLAQRGASFWETIARSLGKFPGDVSRALWELVWAGVVTNDTWAPLHALFPTRETSSPGRNYARPLRGFRSRRTASTAGADGRWSLLGAGQDFLPSQVSPQVVEREVQLEPERVDRELLLGGRTKVAWDAKTPTTTERQAALAKQLVQRYGVLTREMVASEGVPGGFSAVYPVLKAMEEAGHIRRGYFVAGLGAAQFAAPGAEDLLRQPIDGNGDHGDKIHGSNIPGSKEVADDELMILGATDPANPYGSALPWPPTTCNTRPKRVAGARVFLARGALVGYLGRKKRHLLTFGRSSDGGHDEETTPLLTRCLLRLSEQGEVVYLAKVNGTRPQYSALDEALREAGFTPFTEGFLLRAAEPPTG